MKNPNEPKLDKIKIRPTIRLGEKPSYVSPVLDKKNPLIRLLKNDSSR